MIVNRFSLRLARTLKEKDVTGPTNSSPRPTFARKQSAN